MEKSTFWTLMYYWHDLWLSTRLRIKVVITKWDRSEELDVI